MPEHHHPRRRIGRRPLLIAANLGGAGLVCVLLLVSGRGQVWLIYAVMFGYGAANGLITAAQTALLTDLVLLVGIGVATVFRFWSYRKWVWHSTLPPAATDATEEVSPKPDPDLVH